MKIYIVYSIYIHFFSISLYFLHWNTECVLGATNGI